MKDILYDKEKYFVFKKFKFLSKYFKLFYKSTNVKICDMIIVIMAYWKVYSSLFYSFSEDWKLVKGPFMILIKL